MKRLTPRGGRSGRDETVALYLTYPSPCGLVESRNRVRPRQVRDR